MSSRMLSIAVLLLTACGAEAPAANEAASGAIISNQAANADNAANAAVLGNDQFAQNRPRVGFENFDRGGMAGCFDPSLSGYPRRAAEEAGGVPCEDAAEKADGDSAAPPSPRAALLSSAPGVFAAMDVKAITVCSSSETAHTARITKPAAGGWRGTRSL